MMQVFRKFKNLKPIQKAFDPFSRRFPLFTPKYPNIPKFNFSNLAESTVVPPTAEAQAANLDEINRILHSESPEYFRNIAIIAHVDHGKTTLVDCLLRQGGCFIDSERAMDSNALEQEKGITILSKCTGITYKGYKINIVDTPGHHDFGGEVERIMGMVDGVLLLVCATEGPMAQTKFVLQKALAHHLKPIVVINKVDRPTARVKEVETEIFDLFCSFDVCDETIDYPVIYTSARDGWASFSLNKKESNIFPILDTIIKRVPPPKVEVEQDFSMLVSQTESNPYFGKMLIGKITSGSVKVNDKVSVVDQDNNIVEKNKILKIVRRYGTSQIEMKRAVAGDIISIAGLNLGTVGHTMVEQGKTTKSIPSTKIDPPMMSIRISVNNSPCAGKEGTLLTASAIKERLIKEAENDVALRVEFQEKGNKGESSFTIQGRGDLHLGVLIEKMRREGFEMQVTPPEVLLKEKNGKKQEPIEKVVIELDPVYSPLIIEKMSNRKATYEDCQEINPQKHKLTFHCPTRGLIGFRTELLHETRGTAIMNSHFQGYGEYRGPLKKSQKGTIVAMQDGVCNAYGIKELEKFGTMFVKPGQKVYNGMIIGEHNKEADVELNPTKEKRLTNVRSTQAEEKIVLNPPRIFTLEEALSYVRDDEIIEVTPKEIRMRKRELDPTLRKKQRREVKEERLK